MLAKHSAPARIDVLDPDSISLWTAQLGVSEAQLREAVRRFGTIPSTVRAGLGLPPA